MHSPAAGQANSAQCCTHLQLQHPLQRKITCHSSKMLFGQWCQRNATVTLGGTGSKRQCQSSSGSKTDNWGLKGRLARPDTGLAIIYNCFKTFAFQLGIHCDSPAANVFGLHRLEWPCLPERIKVYLGNAVCSLAGLVVVSAVHSVSRMFNF